MEKKHFITNGQVSSVVVVMAKTKPTNNQDSMSAFVVEKSTGGLTVGNKDDKMGMRAAETVELFLRIAMYLQSMC